MGILKNISNHGFYGDYFTDRLVRIYSFWIFVILAFVLAVAGSGISAITCWVPAHFTSSAFRYTEEYCLRDDGLHPFISEDAFLSPDQIAPVNALRLRRFPILLFFQALLFLLPWMLWKLISGGACNLNALVREAERIPAANTASIRYSMSGHLQKLICNPCTLLGSVAGGYVLSLTYLFTKFLSWIICFVQIATISNYFGIRYFSFMVGQQVWESYTHVEIDDNTTQVVVPFPRKVLCDFEVQRLGTVQRYTVQCSLGISETIESCLSVIWYWMVLVLVIVSLSGAAQFLHTILRCVRPMSYSKRFLKQRLAGVESFSLASSEVIQKFSQLYLKPDMFFIIGMIEENGSISAATLSLKELWEEFLNVGKVHVDPERRLAEEIRPSGPAVVYSRHAGDLSENQGVASPSAIPYEPLQNQLKESEARM